MKEKKEIQLHDKVFELFISAAEMETRIKSIAAQIKKDFSDKKPLFIGVLNGAFMFTADLVRACEPLACEVIFVKLSSYEGMASSGKVISVIGLSAAVVRNRNVIIVEDIVDTGKTMSDFMATLATYEPLSMSLVTMFHKPDALQHTVIIDHIGFSIPDKFIVGYGLDYDGLGRNLCDVYQLKTS